MDTEYIVPFVGFSGDGVVDFDTGEDRNKLFKLSAETIVRSATALYPYPNVRALPPIKSWTHSRILRVLSDLIAVSGGRGKIKQVHIFTHGGTSRLSLAYEFENGRRIQRRAEQFNRRAQTIGDKQAALEALDQEDALLSGTLSVFPRDPANDRNRRVKLIQECFSPNAYLHIWGCYAGAEHAEFGLDAGDINSDDDRKLDKYLRRFELLRGKPAPGVARDIAQAFHIPVTAAQLRKGKSEGGVSFFYRERGRVLLTPNKKRLAAPVWMWPDTKARWVTWGPDGKPREKVRIFDSEFSSDDVRSGTPPAWFTGLYR